MDSSHTPSPHCIPSPPIFSLDVRNLGHLCFEELPAAATTSDSKGSQPPNFVISQNQSTQQKVKTEVVEVKREEPTTFLPIEQHTAESKSDMQAPLHENNNNNNCDNFNSTSPIMSPSDEDIFDEIFTTFEDILECDDDKAMSALLYGEPQSQYDTSPSTHQKGPEGSDPSLVLSLGSTSGHITLHDARSTSPSYLYNTHAIRNPQAYEYESSSSSNGSSNGSVSEPGSDTMEGCIETLREHHNSNGMAGFIDKFGKLKPQHPATNTCTTTDYVKGETGSFNSCTNASTMGWTGDSREQLLARAMAMAQQSSYQTQQQKLKQKVQQQKQQQQQSESLPSSGSSACNSDVADARTLEVNRQEDLTVVGSKSVKQSGASGTTMDNAKRSRSQPITPSLLVSLETPSHAPSQPAAQHSHHNQFPIQQQQQQDVTTHLTHSSSSFSTPSSSIPDRKSTTGNKNTSSTSSTNSFDVSEIPIASRALPLLPTSLESFRSQLSQSKKESLSRKKNLPPNSKKSAKHSQVSPASSLGGIAVNSKKAVGGGAGNKNTNTTKAKKSSKGDSKSSTSSNNYDLSQYFSNDEINGLLSAICSDDENDAEDGNVGGHSLGSLGHSHGHGADLLQEHVVFTPHVDKNDMVFSFNSSNNSGSSSSSGSNSINITQPQVGSAETSHVSKNGTNTGEAKKTTAATQASTPAIATNAKKRKGYIPGGTGGSPIAMKKAASSSNIVSNSGSRSTSITYTQSYSPNLTTGRQLTGRPLAYGSPYSESSQRVEHATRVMAGKRELAQRNAYSHHYVGGMGDAYSMPLETQRKIAEDAEKVLKMQTAYILQDSYQRQLTQQNSAMGGVTGEGGFPSLLSSLNSVGASSNRLQGLAGLSSVLQGGNTGIPSLSSMYANSANNFHNLHNSHNIHNHLNQNSTLQSTVPVTVPVTVSVPVPAHMSYQQSSSLPTPTSYALQPGTSLQPTADASSPSTSSLLLGAQSYPPQQQQQIQQQPQQQYHQQQYYQQNSPHG